MHSTPHPELPGPVAFVLGGGGAWGAVQVGMLHALAACGIQPDLVVGTSVGSLNGVVLADDPAMAPDHLATLWPTITRSQVLPGGIVAGARSMRKGWLFPPNGVAALIRASLRVKTIEDLPIPFVAVATDFDTGERVDLDSGDLESALLASFAIPGVYPPVVRNGRRLVDGGLVANVAVDVAVKRGARSVVVLDCGLLALRGRLEDSIVGVLVRSAAIMASQQLVAEILSVAHLPVVWLAARELNLFTQLDFTHTEELIEAGDAGARAVLDQLPGGVLPAGLYGIPPTLRTDVRLRDIIRTTEVLTPEGITP